ncbi:MAG: bifunctional hydroxymethylpyrimidine kinase/phosphomethylpyrimidine kinase [Acidimicrobiia bacterium]|nr:bifunctional hydroxymethylpyrimidine kinase/phosphomethylpyrimidine kinase [Acidimicrobiia bacterium]MYG72638.1 bifunctional hydroxymethylpyrimidine kinase/phosphomethylpyrimidine kinase [Acidimicrobiia bacterium]
MNPPVALSVAGSDPSGGAGVAADLTTFAALGVHGTAVITAVTAQNTAGVQGIHPIPADFVAQQLDSVLDDLPVAAVKTGMLANRDVIAVVGEYAAAGRLPNLVVDPVMVSSTGARLLDAGAEAHYVELLRNATVATPNGREAAVLQEVAGLDDFGDLGALCPGWMVVTGEATATDRVHHGGDWRELAGEVVETANDHGTGCTFSSAVAAGLAAGQEPMEAIATAKGFARQCIVRSADWDLGTGRGPVAHLMEPEL